ncbi:MAG TPA: phosphoribosylamine--glycine ligase [Blastocatellia bacterium]|nr:phosphoribosylamine--glycine ligase [Blastocatellia bacterium]
MKVLVIGSGGREHALVWALARSPHVQKIYNNSTNAGILNLATRINESSIPGLASFAESEGIDLTVVGPEQPLVEGVVDVFAARGLTIFGPSQAAAQLEGSKVFAKQFMLRHGIPTARAVFCDDQESALKTVSNGSFLYPLVIKADGLAAGKGVVVAADETIARATITDFMAGQKLGAAGNRLLIEECLVGRELSYLLFADGKSYCSLPVAQDHKRAFDGDEGPNTGGMGVFSTPGLLDEALEQRIVKEIVEPSLAGTAADGFPFRGVLFIGLMLTADGPQVLEYNVRLGDPETQAVLRRLDSDLAELILASTRGELEQVKPVWSNDSTSCVVMASAGYPGSYETGKVITGIGDAEQIKSVTIFHAGTRQSDDGSIETAGGRVLAVTARAATLTEATRQAYQGVAAIQFEGAHFRRDIGTK